MSADTEIRRDTVVLGPGKPGFLRLSLGRPRGASAERIVEVPIDSLPAPLRVPNTRLIAVTDPEGVLRVEEYAVGRLRLDAEESVRRILIQWDPIGTADVVVDEYDGHIGGVLRLLRSKASERVIAEHLGAIAEGMGLHRPPMDRLLSAASALRKVPLPMDADGSGASGVSTRGAR